MSGLHTRLSAMAFICIIVAVAVTANSDQDKKAELDRIQRELEQQKARTQEAAKSSTSREALVEEMKQKAELERQSKIADAQRAQREKAERRRLLLQAEEEERKAKVEHDRLQLEQEQIHQELRRRKEEIRQSLEQAGDSEETIEARLKKEEARKQLELARLEQLRKVQEEAEARARELAATRRARQDKYDKAEETTPPAGSPALEEDDEETPIPAAWFKADPVPNTAQTSERLEALARHQERLERERKAKEETARQAALEEQRRRLHLEEQRQTLEMERQKAFEEKEKARRDEEKRRTVMAEKAKAAEQAKLAAMEQQKKAADEKRKKAELKKQADKEQREQDMAQQQRMEEQRRAAEEKEALRRVSEENEKRRRAEEEQRKQKEEREKEKERRREQAAAQLAAREAEIAAKVAEQKRQHEERRRAHEARRQQQLEHERKQKQEAAEIKRQREEADRLRVRKEEEERTRKERLRQQEQKQQQQQQQQQEEQQKQQQQQQEQKKKGKAKRDPYVVLGVSIDSTQEDIKRAYRRLSLKHHPDKNPNNPDAADKFAELVDAYEILGDADKRAMHDDLGGEEYVSRPKNFNSKTGFYAGSSLITSFNETTFRQLVLCENVAADEECVPWMIEYYATWCVHCKNMIDNWKRAASQMDGTETDLGYVRFGAVNCESDRSLCQQQEVNSFPTLRLYARDKHNQRHMEQFPSQKDRSPEAIIAFAEKSVRLASEANLVQLTGHLFEKQVTNPEFQGLWLILFESGALHCPQCGKIRASLRRMSANLRGLANVGVVDCSQEGKTCKDNHVTQHPTIKMYPYKGAKGTGEVLFDSRNADPHIVLPVVEKVIRLTIAEIEAETALTKTDHDLDEQEPPPPPPPVWEHPEPQQQAPRMGIAGQKAGSARQLLSG